MLETYVYGFLAGLSVAAVGYPVMYHWGWKVGYERAKDIWTGKER